MSKDRLYFLTFISILSSFIVLAFLGLSYGVKISVNLLLDLELEASKKEVQKIVEILHQYTENNKDKDVLIDNIQEVLYVVEPDTTYLSVIDNNNTIICHPKVSEINEETIVSKQLGNSIRQGIKLGGIHDILMDYKNKLYDNQELNVIEVLYEKKIRNTELKLVSVVNLDKLLLRVMQLKRRLNTIFIVIGICIITVSFFTVRYISSIYEKNIESKNLDLENDIVNMAKLNLGVFANQQKVAVQESIQKEIHSDLEQVSESQRVRLLTYKGDELIPTFIEDIAYVFTENSVSYVVDMKGNKTFSNFSLDDIYTDLDQSLFFRANRQYIIHVKSIEKVIKYGNRQLKILIHNTDVDILISKNKAADFKKWLNV